MRFVFVGASQTAERTAHALAKSGHEVVIVEANQKRIEELSEKMDCSFLHGDGSRPEILRETNPEHTNVLFCLTDNDKDNLIAGLVGQTLGFKRVVARIEEAELEDVARALGLKNVIVPSRTISHYLHDLARGLDVAGLSAILDDEARFFTFTAGADDAVRICDLQLPNQARVICFYRDSELMLTDEQSNLREGDEVVILTHSKNLPKLEERWQPKERNRT